MDYFLAWFCFSQVIHLNSCGVTANNLLSFFFFNEGQIVYKYSIMKGLQAFRHASYPFSHLG